MSCPSLHSNADLSLKALPSSQPRKTLLFRSCQSHDMQLRTPRQSQGPSGVSLAPDPRFPDGGTMAQKERGLCSSRGLSLYEGAEQSRESTDLGLVLSQQPPCGGLCPSQGEASPSPVPPPAQTTPAPRHPKGLCICLSSSTLAHHW